MELSFSSDEIDRNGIPNANQLVLGSKSKIVLKYNPKGVVEGKKVCKCGGQSFRLLNGILKAYMEKDDTWLFKQMGMPEGMCCDELERKLKDGTIKLKPPPVLYPTTEHGEYSVLGNNCNNFVAEALQYFYGFVWRGQKNVTTANSLIREFNYAMFLGKNCKPASEATRYDPALPAR